MPVKVNIVLGVCLAINPLLIFDSYNPLSVATGKWRMMWEHSLHTIQSVTWIQQTDHRRWALYWCWLSSSRQYSGSSSELVLFTCQLTMSSLDRHNIMFPRLPAGGWIAGYNVNIREAGIPLCRNLFGGSVGDKINNGMADPLRTDRIASFQRIKYFSLVNWISSHSLHIPWIGGVPKIDHEQTLVATYSVFVYTTCEDWEIAPWSYIVANKWMLFEPEAIGLRVQIH